MARIIRGARRIKFGEAKKPLVKAKAGAGKTRAKDIKAFKFGSIA